MVKFFIKANFLSKKYSIFNEEDNLVYTAESDSLIKARVRLLDTSNQLLYYIKKTSVFPIKRTFEIYQDNKLFAITKHRIGWLKENYLITLVNNNNNNNNNNNIQLEPNQDANEDFDNSSLSFKVRVNGRERDYIILNDDSLQVGSVKRKHVKFRDTYYMDISDLLDPVFFLTIVIIMDKCRDKRRT
ncbi:hypothetical protein DICPUDRAFT_151025 [Dictyostelium purpureum]|uniref:Tubby C-terminal domain-containing protein n=1 Tax=Dictyostelium purpureum TaxID=5786 RepID=F0ZHT9_DICPU|nr:uncharacterized protein DICPUDRAFT_151025 [Dictyostelium purpureum]EGC36468.1 hypothetical protein DICPUDRAFT_151025 [Dictyostelium purpureum]|eukprot:XP_003286981.1 hypothetical protein DICPUDRAFT_151025 [Dictyostelium purpureum]